MGQAERRRHAADQFGFPARRGAKPVIDREHGKLRVPALRLTPARRKLHQRDTVRPARHSESDARKAR